MNRSESKYFNTAMKMNLALISLLKKRPLEYITVSELCKAAGVNRSTFYLHYETIGDLLNETAGYLLRDFFSRFSTDGQTVPLKLRIREPEKLVFICDKYLTPYLTYIKDHKEVFGTALLHSRSLGFEAVYQHMFENIFDPILDRFHYPTGNRQYVMMYYLNGIHAVVVEWLRNDCAQSVEELSEIISLCIYGRSMKTKAPIE